jgi:hypothetical protein
MKMSQLFRYSPSTVRGFQAAKDKATSYQKSHLRLLNLHQQSSSTPAVFLTVALGLLSI